MPQPLRAITLLLCISSFAIADQDQAHSASTDERGSPRMPEFFATQWTPLSKQSKTEDTMVGLKLSALVSSCDRLELGGIRVQDPILKIISDQAALQALAGSLARTNFQTKPLCYCAADTSYRFYHGTQLVLTFSFHHGDTIHAFGDSVSGAYKIGEAAVQELLAIINAAQRMTGR